MGSHPTWSPPSLLNHITDFPLIRFSAKVVKFKREIFDVSHFASSRNAGLLHKQDDFIEVVVILGGAVEVFS